MNIFSGKRYFNDILWAPAYNSSKEMGIRAHAICNMQ